MSALALILADRGYPVSGSDPRESPMRSHLETVGVRVFSRQDESTVAQLDSSGLNPLVVCSTAIPESNPELKAARTRGWPVLHRSDLLAALIDQQPAIAVAGSHGKTTTSTLITELLLAAGEDPTAVIGGVVPSLGRNGRCGQGRLLVAEADESDGTLVKFAPELGVITNLELDHTDHYHDLDALVATVSRFAGNCRSVLANHDCAVLRRHLRAQSWWSVEHADGVAFAALPVHLDGDHTIAEFYESGEPVGRLRLPLPGRHNLSNSTAALAACRMQGVPFERLREAMATLRSPGRRFDLRGTWQGRFVVDDYAHHPSEVAATLAMARLMVESGNSPLPGRPERLVALFQPHRYSRTQDFMEAFAEALRAADLVLLAPLYAAGEEPRPGISSAALASAIEAAPHHPDVHVAGSLDQLADQVVAVSRPGDLLLAMGAGNVNSLWGLLQTRTTDEHPGSDHPPVAA
ncbi:UDP-N-acetylmuramate--L-alanine ligase [Synechococcus sp. RSCCF101]|nr:UDP-N-acetylmuramate--L-alanine ligase [Synechococcus sp. RSCCF101]